MPTGSNRVSTTGSQRLRRDRRALCRRKLPTILAMNLPAIKPKPPKSHETQDPEKTAAHHDRELHRYGDEASWWAAVNIDPFPVALKLWRRSRSFESKQNSPLNPGEARVGATIPRACRNKPHGQLQHASRFRRKNRLIIEVSALTPRSLQSRSHIPHVTNRRSAKGDAEGLGFPEQ